jgi:AraC-like DNA-binding protein
MHLSHYDPVSQGQLHLFVDHAPPAQPDRTTRQTLGPFRIAWNRGRDRRIWVDNVPVVLPAGAFLPLVSSQSLRLEHAKALTLWQFDREFYCIVDHDREVSCAGLLFYGGNGLPVLRVGPEEQHSYATLFGVFVDEMRTRDGLQGEMLRMLLKRLIIKLTRLARAQLVPPSLEGTELDLVRRFNVLVEQHYRTHHRVAEYAAMLGRSAKTLSNVFARHGLAPPLRLVRARLGVEARRLLHYTDRPVKQIATELGFSDVTTFGRFFRAEVGVAPAAFRHQRANATVAAATDAGKAAKIVGSPALRGATAGV